MLPSGRTPIANRDRETFGIISCEHMKVLIGKDSDGKHELKTCKCRLVRREHRLPSKSGMNQRGGGSVDKAAGDRANEDLNET